MAATSLAAFGGDCVEAPGARCPRDAAFGELAASLKAAGYRPADPALQLALDDQPRYWANLLRRAADRAAALERASDPAGEVEAPILKGLGAADLVLRRAEQSGPLFDPSTIPAAPGASIALAHLVPYRVSLDVARGGFAVSWLEPAWLVSNSFSLRSSLDWIDYDRARDRWSSALSVKPSLEQFGLGLGIGPRAALRYTGDTRFDIGLAAELSALQNRVSITVGPRELTSSLQPKVWFVSLSLNDVNGLLYWLLQ